MNQMPQSYSRYAHMDSGSFRTSSCLAFACALALRLIMHAGASAQTAADPGFHAYLTTFENIQSPTYGRVNCILRDDRGFIWFGTTRGLCRYDGYEARVFSNGGSLNTREHVVNAMIQLNGGSLLVGTHAGVWTFDPETGEFTPLLPGNALQGGSVSALARGPGSVIWIGMASAGLIRYDPADSSVQQYSTENGLGDNRITSLLLDSSGMLWVGTFRGLDLFDTKTSVVLNPRGEGPARRYLVSSQITALYENRKGELWIGTDDGAYIRQPQSGLVRRVKFHSSMLHTVWSITQDPAGRMWIAASDLGLFSYRGGVLEQFVTVHDRARTLAGIKTLYVDPVVSRDEALLLWIGTRAGINKLVLFRNPFVNHIRNQHSFQLDRGAVLSMCEDRSGILWVGFWGGGLSGFRKTNTGYRRVMSYHKGPVRPDTLPSNDVEFLLEDGEGRLWIGTPDGLAVLDAQRKHVFTYRHTQGDSTSLLANDINAIHEDRSGTIWIGTRNGLSELPSGERQRFRHHLHEPGDAHPLGRNIVTDIFEDRSSSLWVATFGRGLNKRLPDGTFKRYSYPADTLGTQENWIVAGVEGRSGNFWLSTSAGLVSFDPQSGQFSPYPIAQLHDAPIYGIFEDREGELWLSTAIGLARFNPKTATFLRLDDRYGFPFSELHSGFVRTARGTLLVGGLDGFSEFSPDSVSASTSPPEITLTGVSVFDQVLPLSSWMHREIHLTHDQNFFTFSFAALDYINPPQNRFAYKLEGVDKDWIQAGNHNFATYTHLDPGSYVFRVKGSNSVDVWNETGTSIAVVIAPPYWHTWWFRLMAVVAVIGLGATGYVYSLRRALAVERLRLSIADDLHDDVGSSLSTIAMVSRVVQRAPDLTTATRNRVAEIYETAIKTSERMKDIVWFVKPKDDTIDDLILRMKDTASSILVDLDHEFQAPENGSAVRVTIDFKRNFFLSFKEILANIAKHAGATKVKILVERRGELLEAVIEDNGRGYDEQTIRRGNGLGNLQSRAKKIGGVCEIHTSPGKGTTVRFAGKV